MATQILQQPLFATAPVGQNLMFVVYNEAVVNSTTVSNIKYIAEVHISSNLPPNTSTTDDIVGTFKTVPNAAGSGMFDLSPIIENFVSADNIATRGSDYKLGIPNPGVDIPIHIIDKISGAKNTAVFVVVKFRTQYTGSDGNIYITPGIITDQYFIFNGYLKQTDPLELEFSNYGYNISRFMMSALGNDFFSNAPITQNANIKDYGTLPVLVSSKIYRFTLTYENSELSLLDSEIVLYNTDNGGFPSNNGSVKSRILFFGCFPGNLQNWSVKFNALVSAGTIEGGRIKVTVESLPPGGFPAQISETYFINVNCPKLKGYEPIRLAWLNQWGTWDYYTFNMKSTKTISTKGSTYQQLEGTWNENTHRIYGHKGGKKTFRVNATEKITMNTDFISEQESEWFEDLINSPEVYILKEYVEVELANPSFVDYVTSVRLLTSNYTKKTVANDKLIQYTFEVEKAKTLRTQSI